MKKGWFKKNKDKRKKIRKRGLERESNTWWRVSIDLADTPNRNRK